MQEQAAVVFALSPNVAPVMQAVADILKALAWPIAVVVCSVIFRKQICEVADSAAKRLESFELPGGIKAKLITPEQKQAEVKKPDPVANLEAPKEQEPVSPALAEMEAETRKLLDEIPAADREARLVRGYAIQTLNAGSAFIYSVIFGSQLKALIELGARRKVTSAEALDFYRPYAQKYPELYDKYGFAGWIGFLKNKELIEVVDGDSYQITAFGDAFLSWLKNSQLAQDRPY